MTFRIAAAPAAFLAVALLALAACGPMPEKPVTSLSEVGGDSVLVVGRLELDPPLRPGEQDIKAGTFDPFGAGDMMRDRGLVWFSRSPDTEMEKGEFIMNPKLGELYFYRVPRSTPHMLGGYILAQYHLRSTGYRTMTVDEARIEIPGGLRYDIRPGDTAIYVGTLRLHRDEFNEVTKAVFVDEYGAAATAFKKRFGTGTTLRKAIPRPQ